ncbi:E3 ubiquitin-protein ligase TRIM21-like [Xenopus laevis]|uniref:E3 ubiquitin-protein ligase TRIM21-like n=1 Tax=Xenopus laevis TaxID=8355 RepID=A0A8J1L130_XENLA|nr:E3 ubiquitin-protein ligase TRIM21-like [Xenopus laevis]
MDENAQRGQEGRRQSQEHQLGVKFHQLDLRINNMEEMCNMCDTLCSLLAQESHGAALCGAEGAHNEGGTDGIMAPGLAHTVLGIRTLICGQEATDLLLDINTAHNHVSVSGDRKSASFSLTKLHYPQSPERFRGVIQALSSRSFPSGRHYWEVEGSESGGWAVGVAYPSIERSGDQAGIGENNKSWCLYRWDYYDRYTVIHDSKWRDVPQVPSCRRIGIWLDYEAGRLSFYELSEPIRHLHTFTATFTEPLHAAFWVGWCAWVRIIKEREKGADIVALVKETDRQIRDREALTQDREKLNTDSRMQEEDVVSHIIHKGETEREELVRQIRDMEEMCNIDGAWVRIITEREKEADILILEKARDRLKRVSEDLTPGRKKLEPETQMQEEDVVSHIIHKGETEREELVGQILDMEEMCFLGYV